MNLLLKLTFSALLIATTTINATANETSQQPAEIAVLSDARVFAQFNDKYPAMVNYFTKADIATIKQFYNTQYGSPFSERVQYGRLEMQFEHLETDIRVIVAEQKHHHEVDVIVIKKPNH
ncbi:hypothetical protein [Thalassotalea maritima]|uniref:hypothetical protein n=1 Tax=Thalassotalea maritima TaxID=3242416 RepID=UPI00352848FA